MAEISISDFVRKTRHREDRVLRVFAIKLFSAVIRDMPVGNPDLWKVNQGKPVKLRKGPAGYVGGRLRANWNCSLGMPDLTNSESTDHGKAIPAATETCLSANRFDSLWLSNSVPYVRPIEYDGHSSQARQGMVRRNVARVKPLIIQTINAVVRGI